MLKCSECGRELNDSEALVNKNAAGEKNIICHDCFQKIMGVDYKTFAYRKENAKQTLVAVIFCLAATFYAFLEKGPAFGALGIVLTILVYLFASKAR